MLAKSMQKHAGRAKEKILQNLGKVDRTADEIFDDHMNNFNRQQASANRLQKEFNNYIRCIRAVQVASKSLMDAIGEIYEPQWTGYDALQAQSAASESLWQDFSHKLGDQVLIPLNTYTGQFPEMKKKIEKRNRKLIDYDGQRHSFQSLQANANKRKDDVKLTKGREQLEDARRTYEILNTELHDELPALYDSRILFLVTNLQTLFATENVFHSETAKIYSELEAIVDKLATDSQRGSNTLRKQASEFAATNAIKTSSPLQSPIKQLNNSNYQNQITTNGSSNANSPTTSSSSSQPESSRLYSVSSTPESTPENLKSSLNITDTTTAPISPARAKQTAAAALATTTTTNNNGKTASTASLDEISKDTNKKLEEVENNVNANTTTITTTPVKNETPIKAIDNKLDEEDEEEEVATRDEIKPIELMNGNATKTTITTTTTTNGNLDNTDSAAALTTTITTTSRTTSNGNEVITEDHKKSLGGKNIYPTLDTKNNDSRIVNGSSSSLSLIDNKKNSQSNDNLDNITKIRKLESKNPFEEDERIYEVPVDATTVDLPPGVLYRVKATYGYVKEDADELSFEIGDIIRVIEYDDPEDQEEGWLMGQKEGTTEKGLFPANFTRPI